MLFVLGDGAPIKPVQDEPATSPFHPVSSHCWFTSSSLELVHLCLSLLEGNNLGAKCKQINQPTNQAAIPVQHSSYHRLFVFPPVFQVAFCGPLKPSVIDKPRKVMGALLFLKLDHLCDVVCSGVAPTPSLATRMD